jgi:hypothetical protein
MTGAAPNVSNFAIQHDAPGYEPVRHPRTSSVGWREIGRAWSEHDRWITWIALFGDRGGALYRSLVVADGAITVEVELEPCRMDEKARRIHRGRCGLPPDDAASIDERIASLLVAADGAAARAARSK